MNTLQIGRHCLPVREVETPDGLLMVPRYVYRHNSGWEVRIVRKEEQLFHSIPDSCCLAGALGSLALAIEKLYDELPNYRTFEQLNPGSSHWYNVRERFNTSGHMIYQCVQTYVCGYKNKLRTVQFYVGTLNTRSDRKLRLAIDQAIGTRCWSIDTIKSEGRSVLFNSPVPKNVERFAY